MELYFIGLFFILQIFLQFLIALINIHSVKSFYFQNYIICGVLVALFIAASIFNVVKGKKEFQNLRDICFTIVQSAAVSLYVWLNLGVDTDDFTVYFLLGSFFFFLRFITRALYFAIRKKNYLI